MDRPPLRILLVETSGGVGRVGVAHGDELLATRTLDPARRHARDLAPAVKELLAEAGWAAKDVTAVFVGRGPGSYTGLRVGVMAAKAFAYAAKCDLLAVDSFAAIAAACPPDAGAAEVVADAQRRFLYAQRFARTAGAGWLPATALAIVPKSEWLRGLAPGVLVTGPGLAAVEPDLPPGTPAGRRDADLPGLLAAGLAPYGRGERDDIWACEPLYLHRSSAEENWDRNNPRARQGEIAGP